MPATPTGRTGFPKWLAAVDPPDGAAQDEALGTHFDQLIGETVPTASALPASGNWVGRDVMTEDTKEIFRCVALPGTWRLVSSIEESGTVAPTNPWSVSTETQLVKRAGWVLYVGSFTRGSGSVGLSVPMGVIPAAFRPVSRVATGCMITGSGHAGTAEIDTAGVVTVNNPMGATGVVAVRFTTQWRRA